MRFYHRHKFWERLGFHLLWMGMACTALPCLALCVALYPVGGFYFFLETLHEYRVLWLFLLGIFLLIFSFGILVRCYKRAARADKEPANEEKAEHQPSENE